MQRFSVLALASLCCVWPVSAGTNEKPPEPVSGVWYNSDCSRLDLSVDALTGLIEGVYRSQVFPLAQVQVTGATYPPGLANPAARTEANTVCVAVGDTGSDQLAIARNQACLPNENSYPVNPVGRPVGLAVKWMPIDAAEKEKKNFWHWSSVMSGQYFPGQLVRIDRSDRDSREYVVEETLEVTSIMYFPDPAISASQNFPARTLAFRKSKPAHCSDADDKTTPAPALADGQAMPSYDMRGAFEYYEDVWISDRNPDEFIFGAPTEDGSGQIDIYYNDEDHVYRGLGFLDILARGDDALLEPMQSFVWTVSTAAATSDANRTHGSPYRIKTSVGRIAPPAADSDWRASMTVWNQIVMPTTWLKRGFATHLSDGENFFLFPQ